MAKPKPILNPPSVVQALRNLLTHEGSLTDDDGRTVSPKVRQHIREARAALDVLGKVALSDDQDRKLPPGEYLVTDPCYLFRDDVDKPDAERPFHPWSFVCDHNDPSGVVFVIAGHRVLVWGTRDGDGTYNVYDNGVKAGEVGVDSGLLAFYPMKLIEEQDAGTLAWVKKLQSKSNQCATLVTVSGKGTVAWVVADVDDGDLTMGNIFVGTSGEESNEARLDRMRRAVGR